MKMNRILPVITISLMTILLVSGCDSSATKAPVNNPTLPEDDNGSTPPTPTPPPAITLVQAKDAMALNAMAYRIITPVYGLIRPSSEPKNATVNGVPECENGGSFNYTETTNANDLPKLVFEFNDCNTTQPNTKFQDPMIDKCLEIGANIFPSQTPTSEASITSVPAYYAIMNGTVTCEATSETSAYADLDNYVVHAFNSLQQEPEGDNRWSYDMRIDMSIVPHDDAAGEVPNALYTVSVDGYFQGEKWEGSSTDGGTLIDDETWTFNNLTLEADHQGAGKPDIIMASGSAGYVGAVREGDTENNGLQLSVGFDKYAYQFDPSDDDAIEYVTISGKVQASCHPEWITYATVETLEDNRTIRDASGTTDLGGDRMPHSGVMTVETDNTSGKAEATFSQYTSEKGNEKAQITIETEDESKTYKSWREIIEGSSCEYFQEIIDRTIGRELEV